MPYTITYDDIEDIKTDVLVCPSGLQLSEDIHAKTVIRADVPAWIDGSRGEFDLLKDCYLSALETASKKRAKTLAISLLGAGIFPKNTVLKTALSCVGGFLDSHEINVVIAVPDRNSFELPPDLTPGIGSYMVEHTPPEPCPAVFRCASVRADALAANAPAKYNRAKKSAVPVGANAARLNDLRPEYAAEDAGLDTFLTRKEATFSQRLLQLIDDSGMKDSTVYKRANVDRKLFSKIRSNKNYVPKKKTAISFAIALRLDMDATNDLLSRAGLTLSPSDSFDLVIMYFVMNGNYDIDEINMALFKYCDETLGN